MQIWLKPLIARQLIEHARSSAPYECCGVILGTNNEGQIVIPTPNTSSEPASAYHIDDKILSDVFFRAQREHKDVVAFYHSHPHSPAIPSGSDIQLATYPQIPYLIVSLQHNAAEIAAWLIECYRVNAVELVIAEKQPAPQPPSLTIAQKRTVIASVVIAFFFMLILSLSLLPPAPTIPTP